MTPKVHISIHKEYKLRSKDGHGTVLFIVDPFKKWVNVVYTNCVDPSRDFSVSDTIELARWKWVDAIKFGYTIE